VPRESRPGLPDDLADAIGRLGEDSAECALERSRRPDVAAAELVFASDALLIVVLCALAAAHHPHWQWRQPQRFAARR
jgi:hypothetical protein